MGLCGWDYGWEVSNHKDPHSLEINFRLTSCAVKVLVGFSMDLGNLILKFIW